MNAVEPPDDNSWATPFPCPICTTTDVKTVKRISNGFITADNLCTNGHIYTVRWLAVAA